MMDPVKNINGLLQEYQRIDREKSLKKSTDSTNLQESKSVDAEKSVSEAPRDSVVISEDSKSLYDREVEVKQYVQELEHIKVADEKQLAKIKIRLESGYYNEPAVMEKIMHDIMVTAPIPVTTMIEFDTVNPEAESVKARDIEVIRDKIQNDEYNNDQVMSTVVNKILGIE